MSEMTRKPMVSLKYSRQSPQPLGGGLIITAQFAKAARGEGHRVTKIRN
jgi:hypothetical protein